MSLTVRIIEAIVGAEVDVTVITRPLGVQGAPRDYSGVRVTAVEHRVDDRGTVVNADGVRSALGALPDVDAPLIDMLGLGQTSATDNGMIPLTTFVADAMLTAMMTDERRAALTVKVIVR